MRAFHAVPLLALAIVTTLGGVALADAPTLSLGATTTAPQPVGDEFFATLTYNLPAGTYSGLTLTLTRPDPVAFPQASYVLEVSGGTFSGHVQAGLLHTWTGGIAGVLASNDAISGNVKVRLKLERGPTRDETPFPFVGHLSGSYVPAAAQPDDPPIPFDAAADLTVTADASAQPRWNYHGPTIGLNSSVGGTPGVLVRMGYRLTNFGTSRTLAFDAGEGDGGARVDVHLGSKLRFVRAYQGNSYGVYPGNAVEPPTTLTFLDTPAVGAGGGDVRVQMGPGMNAVDVNGSPGYSPEFVIDVLVACEDLAPRSLDNPNPVTPDTADFQATPVASGLVEGLWGGARRAADVAPVTPSRVVVYGNCGDLGGLSKYWSGTAAPGEYVTWAAAFSPPTGVASIDEFMVVDVLPAGTVDVYANNVNPEWEVWFCELGPPADPYLGWDDLIAYAAETTGSRCELGELASGHYWPPAGMMAPTHVVWAATADGTWDASADGLSGTTLYLVTQVDPAYDSATLGPYRNVAYLNGAITVAGETIALGDQAPELASEDPYESSALRTIIDYACPYLTVPTDENPASHALAPGQCSYGVVTFNNLAGTEPALNARIELTVPPGVSVVDATQFAGPAVSHRGACRDGAGTVLDPAFPWTGPLSWTWGTAGDDCYAVPEGNHLSLRFEFCTDPAYPFVDAQSLDFVATLVEGANLGAVGTQCETGSRSATLAFEMGVAAEQKHLVTADCRDDGAIAFVVSGVNSGGQALSELVVDFVVPRAGVNGSDVDAAYDGYELPSYLAGLAAVEVHYAGDAAGVWQVDPGTYPNAAVDRVRLVGSPTPLTLAPYGQPASMTVLLAASGAVGQELYGFGQTVSVELPPAVTSASVPYAFGRCNALRVAKFADLDGDGAQGAGEPALAGWRFEVAGESGVVATLTTDLSGGAQVTLPSGTYTVTELLPPASANPAWEATTPGGAEQQATLSDGGGDVALTFGNRCSCADADDDACTVAVCDPSTRVLGQGGLEELADGSCGVEEAVDCGASTNACYDRACVHGVGPDAGCQDVPNTAACDDGVDCTVSDVCAGGACGGRPDAAACDDHDACTIDACLPGDGCSNVAVVTDTVLYGWVDDDDAAQTLLAIDAGGALLTASPAVPATLPSGDYVLFTFTFYGPALAGGAAGVATVGDLLALGAKAGACMTADAVPTTVVAPPPCDPTGPNAFTLGAASALNLLACGDADGLRDVGGAIAVAGRFTPERGFSVGLELPLGDPDPQAADAALGEPVGVAWVGGMSVASGTFWGDVWSGGGAGDAVGDDVTFGEGGALHAGDPLDLASLCGDVRAVSRYLCAATGSTAAPNAPGVLPDSAWWGETYLVVTHAGTNVFAIEGDDLVGSHTFFVRNPSGFTDVNVLANVFASPSGVVTFERGEVRLEDGMTPEQVTFNFCDTTHLAVRGDFGGGAYGFYASLLAPFAEVDFSYGQVLGAVVVGSWVGDAELHAVPPDEPFDVTTTCGEILAP